MFSNLQNGTWGGAGETALFSDVGVAKITKAKAIETLLSHIGASKEDTIAFGDSMNDAEVLEAAEIGVAMGNAEERVKEIADIICETVEDDGVVRELERQGLL